MSFKFKITPALAKQLDKLAHRDKALAIAIRNKIAQIIHSDIAFIEHFKNLRGNLKDCKRVHVRSFVLMFKIEGDTLIFDKFEHHDDAY